MEMHCQEGASQNAYHCAATYSEKEVNKILSRVYEDYVLLRRYLIEYGFLDRTRDGAVYFLK